MGTLGECQRIYTPIAAIGENCNRCTAHTWRSPYKIVAGLTHSFFPKERLRNEPKERLGRRLHKKLHSILMNTTLNRYSLSPDGPHRHTLGLSRSFSSLRGSYKYDTSRSISSLRNNCVTTPEIKNWKVSRCSKRFTTTYNVILKF